ncbi:MAG: thioredoxin domain-containing protein [Candidatus Berkelbacteria bacterium]|nr:thioredoxin domain-containing protein [Candidatus Berkelbacteria bacterium]
MKTSMQVIITLVVIAVIGFGIYEISKKNSTATNTNTASQGTSDTSAPVMITDPAQKSILQPKSDDLVNGISTAAVTLVEYSDFQCPYCVRFGQTMEQIMANYPGQVKWIYRHYPLSFHQNALGAAKAAEAANRQGKFVEFSEKLLANSQSDGAGIAATDLQKYATDLGLNIDQFNKDIADQAIVDKINANQKSGDDLKIEGTPASYIIDTKGNIEALSGALPYDELKAKIDAALKN